MVDIVKAATSSDPLTTALGGLFGFLGGSGSTSKSTNQEPWSPAQPYLLDALKQGQALNQYYQQNPFNAQQKAGYQNVMSDADYLRQNVMPGVMQFANNAMGGSYSRNPVGVGMGNVSSNITRSTPTGGPFGVAPGQAFGQIDWAKINPFTQSQTAPAAQSTQFNEDGARPGSWVTASGQGGDIMSTLQKSLNTPQGAYLAYLASRIGLLGNMTQQPAPVEDRSFQPTYYENSGEAS